MRIRINLLSLLRTLLRIAGTVQTLAELILASQGQRAADSPAELDLDAIRAAAADQSRSTAANDPSAAR